MSRALLALGNQQFPASYWKGMEGYPLFMAEDEGLCTYYKFHQLKLVLFLASMREFRDLMKTKGFRVDYQELSKDKKDVPYEEKLSQFCKKNNISELLHFQIEDKFFDERISTFCQKNEIKRSIIETPMFLTTDDAFDEYASQYKRLFFNDFYIWQRKRLNVLLESSDKPRGGQWSFDADNRKKLSKKHDVPEVELPEETANVRDVKKLVSQRFADHPGEAEQFYLPVNRQQALRWLDQFLEDRMSQFGPYEDAFSDDHAFVFHSVLSPVINLGLITPEEVVERTLDAHRSKKYPLNSVEGFIRQIIGWREFIRQVYRKNSEFQEEENFWNHNKKLTKAWYTGDTGLPYIDKLIKKVVRYGYNHHIERLMGLGNIFLLLEIDPKEVHRWFMEMYVDSSDWVMGPNVYGMSQFSDGGLFATKPYICGSNYIRKMSHEKTGDWCDIVDGLYWRFIDKHSTMFSKNQRMSMMVRSLEKMNTDKKTRIFKAAQQFQKQNTID